MALKLLSDASRLCAVQGLRAEATQAFVEGVETPHGRASELLQQFLQRPPERPLPSEHRGYRCSYQAARVSA